LKDVSEIGVVRLGQNDVIRHSLVKKIIEAFEKVEEEEKNKKNQ
jgi:phosphate starvation-inducible PhoH-like protein